MEENKPNYWSILPANVRYDPELKSTEKLLYSEITALTGKEGICWASNNYFAKLYNVTPHYISNLINRLAERGYINIEYEYKGKEITKRKINLLQKSVIGITKNCYTPITKKCKDNNININNINRIIPTNNFSESDLQELYEN